MTAPRVELVILDERVRGWGLPRYRSDMAAGIDLHACLDAPLVLPPGSPAQLVSTGIAILMGDPGMTAIMAPRSGAGHGRGLVLGNLVGIIDADYTGPLMVSAWNRNPPSTPGIVIEPGERLAQLVFVPVLRPVFQVVETFSRQPPRGTAGFGSTGRTG